MCDSITLTNHSTHTGKIMDDVYIKKKVKLWTHCKGLTAMWQPQTVKSECHSATSNNYRPQQQEVGGT